MPITFNESTVVDWGAYHERLNKEILIGDVLTGLGVDVSNLNGSGKGHVLCPVHNDTDPSMHVLPDENYVRCFGACGTGWGPITLFATVRGIEFTQAADELGELFGISPDDPGTGPRQIERPETAVKEIQPGVWPSPLDIAQVEKHHRSLTDEGYAFFDQEWLCTQMMVNKLGLGHKDVWPPCYTIPVWGEEIGKLFSVRFRRDDAGVEFYKDMLEPQQSEWISRTKYWGTKGRNQLLPFGLWTLKNSGDFVILIESENSVCALGEMGLPVLTLTGGVSGHLEGWKRWERYLEPFAKWVVVFDDDPAGRTAAYQMKQWQPDKVRLFTWPVGKWGGKDTLDFLKLRGDFGERVELALGLREPVKRLPPTFWFGCGDLGKVVWANA